MIDYTSETHKAQARKMPRLSKWWFKERSLFDHFVKSRLPGCTITIEHKALVIQYNDKMWCIGSGKYLVFRDDGQISVMFPSSFHDVWKPNDS